MPRDKARRSPGKPTQALQPPKASDEAHRPARVGEPERSDEQRALEASREWYADLYDYAPLGYVTLDGSGTVLESNVTACEMLDVDRHRFESWPFRDFVVAADEASFAKHLERCRAGEHAVRTELRLKKRSGQTFPSQLLSRFSASSRGDSRAFRTAIVDLTDRRRIEEALLRSEQRLQAAVEASGAGVFEYETPADGDLHVSERVASILGYDAAEPPEDLARWVSRRLHQEDREHLEHVLEEVHGGARERYAGEVRIRHDEDGWRWLKVWARIADANEERGPGRVVGVVMDVTEEKQRTLEVERRAEQLEEMADLLVRADRSVRSLVFQVSPPVLDALGLIPALEWLAKDLGRQFDLDIEIKREGDPPPLEPRLRFMMYRSTRELLINVAKHAGTHRARVEVSQVGENRLRIRVQDDGKGFEPGKAKKKGQRRFGLFSIQERLVSLGGSVDVESALGQGTEVTLELPILRPETSASGAAESAPVSGARPRRARPAGRKKIRVLIVDDHAMVRSALARMLAAQDDIEVVGEANDGEGALELSGQFSPDVVVMDVTMPGMGGLEATRRLSREQPQVRVIGLSMHESEDVALAMKEAGASSYVRKTMAASQLLGAVRVAHREAADARSP